MIRVFAGTSERGNLVGRDAQIDRRWHCSEAANSRSCTAYIWRLRIMGAPHRQRTVCWRWCSDVDSPWFGVNLDTGNFHSDDIYGELAKSAPYALNVQVKVAISGPDGKKRPTDYARVAQILRDSEFSGYIALEYEEGGDPREQSRLHTRKIREAFE